MKNIGLDTRRLEELFAFKQGIQVPVEEQLFDYQIGYSRFIRIVDLTTSNEPYRYVRTPKKSHLISSEDLFMVRYGAAGVVGIGFEGVIANNLFRLIPTKDLCSKYFYYLFIRNKRKLDILSASSTMPALSFKDLRGLKVTFHIGIEKQMGIANTFTTIDQKINLLTKKKEALETYKKGLMQKIFSQELRFKREDGTDYPEWDMINLGDITSISIGEFVIKTKQSDDGQYPVYNGGQTPTGYYDEYNNEGNKIVISARGASAGFVNFQYERYWAGNSCYSVSLTKPTYSIRFFYHYLKAYQRRFTDYQQAANIPSVSKKDVQLFQVKVPCDKEQNRIAEFFDLLDISIENVGRQLIAIHKQKKGLLQQIFV